MTHSLDDRLRIREWERQRFHDPAVTLRRLRALEGQLAHYKIAPRVRDLRTNRLKRVRQWRQTALFCHGMGAAVLGTTLYYSTTEAADYDTITWWNANGAGHFAPLQMKEWVPAELNPNASLEEVLAGIGKYPSSKDLTVAIHVNREGVLNVHDIRVPQLDVAEVWLFGATAWQQNSWMLFGNLLKSPRLYKYTYPT